MAPTRSVAVLCVVLLVIVHQTNAFFTDVVQTVEGPVKGYVTSNVDHFRGIPYAAPPVGDNRLRAPQPVTPWTSTKWTLLHKDICPQTLVINMGKEDCLYLNVFTPHNRSQTEMLPVLVWIYGGAYEEGDGYEFGMYDATNRVNRDNYVVVTFNYRLGALGFLAYDSLKSEDKHASAGNWALQDQRAVLEWVQRNIRAFGGDPSRVTIAGESAGAFSVCFHLVSPLSKGLFAAAIMESGTCDTHEFFVPYANAQQWSQTWATMVGCDSNVLNGNDLITCLRGLTMEQIMGRNIPSNVKPDGLLSAYTSESEVNTLLGNANPQSKQLSLPQLLHAAAMWDAIAEHKLAGGYVPALYPSMDWGVTIDGSDAGLLDVPLNSIKSGNWNKVPVITGFNHDEGILFVLQIPKVVANVSYPMKDGDLPIALDHLFKDPNITNAILDVYPSADFNTTNDRASAIMRDYYFVCSNRRIHNALSAQGYGNWMYHFSYKGDWVEDPYLGNYHSAELEYVWDNAWPPLVHKFSDRDQAISDTFGTYWANLIYYGSPNGSKDDKSTEPALLWPTYDSSEQITIIDVPPRLSQSFQDKQCDVWDVLAQNSYKH